MIIDYQALSITVIGFLGGILGALTVNIVSYKIQKKEENKEQVSRAKIEYKDELKSKLLEIAINITSTLQIKYDFETFQNELKTFSKEFTFILSKRPSDFSPEMEEKVLDIDDSLRKINHYFLAVGEKIEDEFEPKCSELVEKIMFDVLHNIDSELYE